MAAEPTTGRPETGFIAEFGTALERHRMAIQYTADVVAWAIGLTVAMILRYEFTFDPTEWGPFSAATIVVAVIIAAALQLITGLASGLYRGRFRFGSPVISWRPAAMMTATTMEAAENGPHSVGSKVNS